jgi:hypothetical protein
MAALAADTVGPLLRDRGTRGATLDALEAHAAPIERAVALGAAPALHSMHCPGIGSSDSQIDRGRRMTVNAAFRSCAR